MPITPLFSHNYQITTLIDLLQVHSQAVFHSTFLTAYMTLNHACVQ